MRKIYLAGPYSHKDQDYRVYRFKSLNMIAAWLIHNGNIVFSPISHTHPIATQCDLPLGWEFWDAFDQAFIEWADVVVVAMLPGWEDSVGVTAEISIAKELGKPVEYFDVALRGLVL